MALNLVTSVLVLIAASVVKTVWQEVKALTRSRNYHAQMLQRHEAGINETRWKLELESMPPLVADKE